MRLGRRKGGFGLANGIARRIMDFRLTPRSGAPRNMFGEKLGIFADAPKE